VTCAFSRHELSDNDSLPLPDGRLACFEHAARAGLSRSRRGRVVVLVARRGPWAMINERKRQ